MFALWGWKIWVDHEGIEVDSYFEAHPEKEKFGDILQDAVI